MPKKWYLLQHFNQKDIFQLQNDLSIDKNLSVLLSLRGIGNYNDAKSFFRPDIKDLHNPFMMHDMDLAVKRIDNAFKNNERIMIFGDYDVDGTTATALVYEYLSQFSDLLFYYIPDRNNEGYGISFQSIDFAEKNKISLIIALDCGIRSIDKVQYAKNKGIDYIICDHHLPGDEIPDAYAVLDPKKPGCMYPYKELSGCGIGFKLMQALCMHYQKNSDDLNRLLDLTAVSIACDIVPVTGENRILAFYGLIEVNKRNRPGISELIDISGLGNRQLQISDLVFYLGPRINAAGRINSGLRAVELLLSENLNKAKTIASEVNDDNNERKTVDTDITETALKMLESETDFHTKKTTVLYHESWHKGVIGIVASRMIEKYYRPTIMLTLSNGKVVGSARSVRNFDVHEALSQCSDLLEQFGGHTMAAGLTMKPEKVNDFKNKFEKVVSSTISNESLIAVEEADLEINLNEISDKFIRITRQMAPHGPGNQQPSFIARNAVIKGNLYEMRNNSFRFEVYQPIAPEKVFQAVAFNKPELKKLLEERSPFHILFSIDINTFNNKNTVQLRIKDFKSCHERI